MKIKYIIFSLIALTGQACCAASREERQARNVHLAEELLEKHNYNPQAALFDAAQNDIPEAINYLIQQGARISDLSENQKEKLQQWRLPADRGSFVANPENLNQKIAATIADKDFAQAKLSTAEKKITHQIRAAIKKKDEKAVEQMVMAALIMGGGLPDEIIVLIVEFLNPQSLKNWAQVSKKFNAIAKERVTEIKKTVINPFLKQHNSNLQKALRDAAENNNLWVIYYLLPRDVNVDATNLYGITGLMLAAANGHNNVVTKLIQAKANVNINDSYNRTALMAAAMNNNAQIVQTLLDGKADINQTNISGLTALDIAKQNNANDVIQILQKRASKRNCSIS